MVQSATGRNAYSSVSPLRLIFKAARLAALLVVAVVVMPLTLVIGRPRLSRIVRWWYVRLLHVLDVHTRVHGKIPETPILIVANHCSWLDILVLGHVFDTAFISKAGIKRWPLIGVYARALDTVFLARGAYRTDEARDRVRATLAHNRSVVLFAEGTTSASPAPKRFHARLFSAALDTDYPVLPVALRYSDATTAAGCHHPQVPWTETPLLVNFIHVFCLRGLRADVNICAPIAAAGHTRRSLAEASRTAISRQTEAGAGLSGCQQRR